MNENSIVWGDCELIKWEWHQLPIRDLRPVFMFLGSREHDVKWSWNAPRG